MHKAKKFLKDAAAAVVFMIVVAGVTYIVMDLVLDAAIREQEFNENIRIARCERMGENIPQQMIHYCDGIGG